MPLHIRLCHSCLYLNEGLSEVGQCRRCKKHLTFDSFLQELSTEELADLWLDENFDDSGELSYGPEKAGQSDFGEFSEDETDEDLENGPSLGPPRLMGLSVIW